MKYEVLDIETVAGLLGVSTRQVRTYVSQYDMPAGKEGRSPVFNWPEVLEWYVGYKSAIDGGGRPGFDRDEDEEDFPEATPKEDIYKATLRKTRADADLKELALSRQRGEVIAIADAKTRLDRMMGNLRSKLLSMAPKLASRIEGLKARTEREAAIKDELEVVCREISTGAVVDLAGDEKVSENSTVETAVALEASAVGEICGYQWEMSGRIATCQQPRGHEIGRGIGREGSSHKCPDELTIPAMPTNVQILADVLNAEAYG